MIANPICQDDHNFAVRPSVQLCQEITDSLTNRYEVSNHFSFAPSGHPKDGLGKMQDVDKEGQERGNR